MGASSPRLRCAARAAPPSTGPAFPPATERGRSPPVPSLRFGRQRLRAVRGADAVRHRAAGSPAAAVAAPSRLTRRAAGSRLVLAGGRLGRAGRHPVRAQGGSGRARHHQNASLATIADHPAGRGLRRVGRPDRPARAGSRLAGSDTRLACATDTRPARAGTRPAGPDTRPARATDTRPARAGTRRARAGTRPDRAAGAPPACADTCPVQQACRRVADPASCPAFPGSARGGCPAVPGSAPAGCPAVPGPDPAGVRMRQARPGRNSGRSRIRPRHRGKPPRRSRSRRGHSDARLGRSAAHPGHWAARPDRRTDRRDHGRDRRRGAHSQAGAAPGLTDSRFVLADIRRQRQGNGLARR